LNQALLDAKATRNLFAEFRITDYQTGDQVSFVPNEPQRLVYERIKQATIAEKPCRLIILKARREGISTALQMLFLKRAILRRFSGLTIAHDEESSAELFRMTEGAYAELPAELRVPKVQAQQGRRLYLTNGGRLRVHTAGSRGNAGRASGFRGIHCSEVAYYPDAKATLAAVRQTVPREPGTIVALESTANGVGDPFHQEWIRATNGLSEYDAVFLPWTLFSRYRLAAPLDFEAVDDAEHDLLTAGLEASQVFWRRVTIANELSGDASMFDQEYPITPEVAFLTSGRPYFPGAKIDVRAPKKRGDLQGDPERGGGMIRLDEHEHGALRIWDRPRPGRRYIIGADVAGKVTLDTYQARGRNDDYSCAQVVDWESGEQVAELHGRWDPDLYGLELARLGWLYNGALVAVESTGGYGAAPLAALLRRWSYPNLYVRTTIQRADQRESDELGWETSEATRPVMLDTLRKWIREHPERFHSDGLAAELNTFVVRRNGSPGAEGGCHDDRVMALAVALEVRRERVFDSSLGKQPVRKQRRPVFAADAAA
jgi:hypothetical protein